MNTIRMNADEIIHVAFSLGKDDPMTKVFITLWEHAKRYEEAGHNVEVATGRIENALAELKAGRTMTYNLVQLGQEIETNLAEQKTRKATFEQIARLFDLEVVE